MSLLLGRRIHGNASYRVRLVGLGMQAPPAGGSRVNVMELGGRGVGVRGVLGDLVGDVWKGSAKQQSQGSGMGLDQPTPTGRLFGGVDGHPVVTGSPASFLDSAG